MEDDLYRRSANGLSGAFQIGRSRLLPTGILTLFVGIAAFYLLPPALFAFGKGFFAPLLLACSLFVVVLLFRRFLFDRPSARQDSADVDAELLEYLVQQAPAHQAEEEGLTNDLLENALHLKEVRAHDCMAPRPEIVHIDVQADITELKQLFMESKLSRIIVTENDLDNVLGYVHVQQLLGNPRKIRNLVMNIGYVPESIPVSDLLTRFIQTRSSIACVVDEYGSLAGLVTLEDALEQLFGEIDDEHDQEEFIEAVVREGKEYIFSGRLEIDYLNKKYPILGLPDGDYTTLSGYLVTSAQGIPEQGARLALDGNRYIVELVSNRKIETVRIQVAVD